MHLKMGRALVPFEQLQDSRGKNDTAVSKGVKRGEKKTAHRAFYFKKFRVRERGIRQKNKEYGGIKSRRFLLVSGFCWLG